jgi:imidazolonepropionase-like amidohydrolase
MRDGTTLLHVISGRGLGAFLLATVVLATAGGDSSRAGGAAARPVYIQADRLFNGRTLVSGRVAVAVRAGRIVAAGRLRVPRGARAIRLRGATILPGFIDLHVHSSPPILLRQGVTTTRNLGQPEAVLRPPFAARGYPREASAGPVITVPGGYPTGRNPGISAPVRTVQEATAKVNTLVAKGAAVIKIALLAEIDGRPLPTLSLDQVRAIVAAAHARRRKVTAHVFEGRGLGLALDGGVDELAHLPCHRVTRDQLAAVAERRIPVVGTLHGARVFLRTQCPDLLGLARTFVRAGGRLLYGTDIPAVAAGLDLAELGLMQQAGLTPTEVLRAATGDAGRQLPIARLGTLVRGAPADLWAVRGDPTRSIKALRRPVFVMARGGRVR